MDDIVEYLRLNWLTAACLALLALTLLLAAAFLFLSPKLFLLIVKNLFRNPVRTLLTSLATGVLVFVVVLILSVVSFIDLITTETAASGRKLIVTERWQLPSQMPLAHAEYLDPRSSKFILAGMKDAQGRPVLGPDDYMTWAFYGGFTEKDPAKRSRDNLVFFFAMEPDHIRTMMDDLQDLDPELVRRLKANRKGCLLGPEKLAALLKTEELPPGGLPPFTVHSLNYKDIDLEFEVVGLLPAGRYNQSAIMNADYLFSALDKYKRDKKQAHPLDEKRIALVWLRISDRDSFEAVAERIEKAPELSNPQVKCETASSGISTWIEPYNDIFWGMKWVLVPVLVISMALVVANAIGISVRERYQEIAVLKVLGYRPWQVLALVLGEALLVGVLTGLLTAAATFALINYVVGGIPFPIAFFPAFLVPPAAIAWATAIGLLTALAGSLIPSWAARSVRVAEVFARVA
jgi:putative ABC transport system permease protein